MIRRVVMGDQVSLGFYLPYGFSSRCSCFTSLCILKQYICIFKSLSRDKCYKLPKAVNAVMWQYCVQNAVSYTAYLLLTTVKM